MKRFSLILAALLGTAACAKQLPLVGAPCPCAAGTVCDEETQLCVSAPVDAAAGEAAAPGPDGTVFTDARAPIDWMPPEPNEACASLHLTTVGDVERFFIAPRCASSFCHSAVGPFPPRNLDRSDLLRMNLLDKNGSLYCKTDPYIDRANPARSYFLATLTSDSEHVTCPSGGTGGTRMPNKDGMPTVAGPKLSDTEIQCLTWWVYQLAKEPAPMVSTP